MRNNILSILIFLISHGVAKIQAYSLASRLALVVSALVLGYDATALFKQLLWASPSL